jgi:hypothetical protein
MRTNFSFSSDFIVFLSQAPAQQIEAVTELTWGCGGCVKVSCAMLDSRCGCVINHFVAA